MYKLKNRVLPYSPSQKITMNMSTGSLSITEPILPTSSAISSTSLVFNGNNWELPLTDGDMEPQIFNHPLHLLPKGEDTQVTKLH